MKRILLFCICTLIPWFVCATETSSVTNTPPVTEIVTSVTEEASPVERSFTVTCLDVVLTPVGKGGAIVIQACTDFFNASRDIIAGWVNMEPDSTLYSMLYVVAWTLIFALIWMGFKRFHRDAYDSIAPWKWVRFFSIASGFCCVLFRLVDLEHHHPDDFWQSALIPLCGLLLSFGLAAILSRKYTSCFTPKAIRLVLLDFLLGFIIACLITVLLMAIMVGVVLVMGFFVLAIVGGGASSRRRPSRSAPKPIILHAEWSGREVQVYTQHNVLFRQFSMSFPVVSVQCSGNGNDATIAITMDNGKTDLFRGTGQLIRRG